MYKVFLFLFLMWTVPLFAMPYWQILEHSTDSLQAQEAIQSNWEKGYVPVGISVCKKNLYVLYIHEPALRAKGWSLQAIDLDNIEQDTLVKKVDDELHQNKIPVGLSVYGHVLYLLFLKGEKPVTQWTLMPVQNKAVAIEQALNVMTAQGNVPMGLSFGDNEFVLLIKWHSASAAFIRPKSWLLKVFRIKDAVRGLNQVISQGFIPFGLSIRGDKIVTLLLQTGF